MELLTLILFVALAGMILARFLDWALVGLKLLPTRTTTTTILHFDAPVGYINIPLDLVEIWAEVSTGEVHTQIKSFLDAHHYVNDTENR